MKRISVLGSTGSIGTQTLDVIRHCKGEFDVVVLTCGHNIGLLEKQIIEFSPKLVCVSEEADAKKLKEEFKNLTVYFGRDGLNKAAAFENTDLVVNALMGLSGFEPTVYALRAKKNIALSNKETLISGGDIIMKLAKDNGVFIYPVDSEHSAIFQCLQGAGDNKIKRLLLTASGGPFRGYTKEQLENVTVEEALNHPVWAMGSKVTIDSATMMNKGNEVIEACTLFDVDPDNVTVVVHKESAMHSAVEFEDGAIIAQMGVPDMKLPISYAINYPNRISGVSESLDLFKLSAMHFEECDRKVFKCLDLAFYAMKKGLSYRVVLNASNEIAVAAFLKGEIRFVEIAEVVEKAVMNHKGEALKTPEDVLRLDEEARGLAREIILGLKVK